ncbi:putative dehydrogenase [Lysobacter dokdonensis DS-58]|uniref:Putative dehydrogenase n=1 Tax=Lysobacter dokdonensis DS-58 TaxID=1300345 RepID=A0A0A2WQ54_9GAMM|nr:SDR family oxidoreductase [Lysobacter dokdonensis]KGQ20430.1 putative dehydrogenase [Lysobacter dokdonensis DS-58]
MKSNNRHSGGPTAALLVLGATGAIGRGVVRAALDAGRPVIAVSPDPDGLRALQGTHAHADLYTLEALMRDEHDAAMLERKLRNLDRPIHGAIVALCSERERGRLLDGSASELRDSIDQGVVAHLALARHLLPLLAQGGRAGGWVIVDGPGGDHPWAGYGHRSVGAAALRMLARVLHEEARPRGVRVQLLALDFPLKTEANAKHACDQWPDARGVGRRAIALLDRVDHAATDPIVHCKGPCKYESQESDGGDASLASRCFEDARRLLGALSPSHKNKNDATHSPSPLSKEDAHDPPTRR